MKKLLLVLVALVLIGAIGGYFVFYFKMPVLDNTFDLSLKADLPNSDKHMNGTWWGYNQLKLARLGDYVFTYNIDNSTQLSDGTANRDNPNKMDFIMIKPDTSYVTFGSANTSRPGNVLVDKERNLIYYFAIEPSSNTDNGSLGRLKVFTYELNDGNPVKIKEETAIECDGHYPERVNIRLAAAIDGAGNLGVAFGIYESPVGWLIGVYTYNIASEEWQKKSTTSMGDLGEPNFYPYIVMKDLDTIFITAVQDIAIEDRCYYQYVRYFYLKDGIWYKEMLVDYRNHPRAEVEDMLVEHTELFIDSKGNYHVITRASLHDRFYNQHKRTVMHFTFDSNFKLIKEEAVKGNYDWIRLVELGEKLYYVSIDKRDLEIVDYTTKKVVHREKKIPDGSYFYVRGGGNIIDCLIMPGNVDNFDSPIKYYQFTLKD